MEKILLTDPQIYPSNEVLRDALKNSYSVYEELTGIVTDSEYGLVQEWNYYKDGKAWLCKVCYKKKTVFWLSVWDSYFKTGFYFTEKNIPGIAELDIDESIKEEFNSRKPVGRLLPLGINMSCKDQLKDLLTIIRFKKSLK
jgi:hypothetical protein